jgi:adenylate kinase family enzyme
VQIFLISGVPGAGKTTVARALAERFPRSAHLEGDRFLEFVVSGRVLPHEEPQQEASRQLVVVRRNLCLIADSFAEAGFVPVVDDVVVSPGVLESYRAQLETRPLVFVQLAPSLEVVRARDAGRDKQWFDVWSHLDAQMRAWTPRPGLWLDSSELTVDETVDAIVANSDNGTV